MIVTIMLK